MLWNLINQSTYIVSCNLIFQNDQILGGNKVWWLENNQTFLFSPQWHIGAFLLAVKSNLLHNGHFSLTHVGADSLFGGSRNVPDKQNRSREGLTSELFCPLHHQLYGILQHHQSQPQLRHTSCEIWFFKWNHCEKALTTSNVPPKDLDSGLF